MVRRLAAAALVLGGCFSPSFDNLRCDPDGDCPAGYTCVAGHCRAGEGPDAAPGPFVVSTSPTDGATDGEPTAAITATFSVPMDPATISDATFTMTIDGEPVAGAVTYDTPSQTATFTPATPLVLFTEYVATITTAVTDLEGTPLGASHDWAFTIRDGAWEGEALIETDDAGQATNPDIGIDDAGNVLVVWQQTDGTAFAIWSNRYQPGVGWGSRERVSVGSGSAAYPELVVNGNGNAIVVWYQNDGTRYNAMACHYRPADGWDAPVEIESGSGGVSGHSVQIGMDAAGNAVATWVQSDGTRTNVWANHYAVGTGWAYAEMIESDNTAAADWPKIAVGGGGHAVVVWKHGTALWANRWDPTTADWDTAEPLDTDIGDFQEPAEVGIDDAGNAIAIWTRMGSPNSGNARRSTPTGGWDAIVPLGDVTASVGVHSVVFDSSGVGTVFYREGGSGKTVRHVPGTGWEAPADIESFSEGTTYVDAAAVDDAGNITAVLEHSMGCCFDIWINRYRVGTGWMEPVLIEAEEDGSASASSIDVTPNGVAAVTWHQSVPSSPNPSHFDIWANVFR